MELDIKIERNVRYSTDILLMSQYWLFYTNVTFCRAKYLRSTREGNFVDFSCYFTGFILVLLRLSVWSTKKKLNITFKYYLEFPLIKLW